MSDRLKGKHIVIIVAHEYEDIELLYPILRFGEEGAQAIVVPVKSGLHPRPSLPDKPVTGRFGHPVPIPVMSPGNRYIIKQLEDVQADEVDCLVFPGGYSPDVLRLDAKTLELVRACHKGGKLITAICHGPWVLISAGIMNGKRATGYVAVKDDLVNAGADFVDAPFICDGNIITGRVPDDLPEFCLAIIDTLSSADTP